MTAPPDDSVRPLAVVRTDVERALVVTAHPDDVDFGAAGTVAAWTAAGIEVTYCICTSGDAGGYDDTPRDAMGPLRRPSSGRPRPHSGCGTSGSSGTRTAG